MNKKLLFVAVLASLSAQLSGQAGRVDTVAVSILDRMSAMVGDLASCSVVVKSNYDVNSRELGLVKHSDEAKLFLRGPDRLLVRSEGDRGSRNFLYDGKTLTYYSQDRNQFGQVQAPPTIMEMIDTVSKRFGIEFPVADFFYPSFVDDILSEAKTLRYIGTTQVDGKECFHIAGTAQDKTFQFWISNDAFYLPIKVVIVYTSKESNPQYEAVLSDWQINPSLPDALFEFRAPPKAKKINLAPHGNLK